MEASYNLVTHTHGFHVEKQQWSFQVTTMQKHKCDCHSAIFSCLCIFHYTVRSSCCVFTITSPDSWLRCVADTCRHVQFHRNPCTRFWVILLTDRQKGKKVKVWTLAIAPLTWVRLMTSSALQSQKWQLIGMNQWCCSALCGHPLPALTDNWTNGAASRHTITPISHTRPSPHTRSYYLFPVPLRVGGWVGDPVPDTDHYSTSLTTAE